LSINPVKVDTKFMWANGPLLVGLVIILLFAWLIGGQTGDVAGAAQQIAEMAFLLTLSACANWTS
jgi:cobalamin synthase